MALFTIFIAEDEKLFASLLQYHLELNPDYKVEVFLDGASLLKNLYKKPDAISLDYSLPDTTADKLLKQIKLTLPETPIIIVSGQEEISVAVELLKEGAYDYIIKNEDTKNRLWNSIKNIRELYNLKKEIIQLKTEKAMKYSLQSEIKGNSSGIQKVLDLIEKATITNINISISGETGTGKELVAKAIHFNSTRSNHPFVPVNVAAIPRELLESELFGHEKGAFTGAIARRIGKFEEANKATLFLDEIAELDLSLQSKLLRVLQEREVVKVGTNVSVKIDVRIITATHKNLLNEVKKGTFREDLYYRLMGLPIHLPPLKERGSDIIMLAGYFIEDFCKQNKLSLKTLSSGAKQKLLSYSYPGNIRELKSIVELSVVLANESEISEENFMFNFNSPIEELLSEELTLEGYERKLILHFLKKYDNNVVLTAQKLAIGKSTIYRLLQENKI